jgi:hypothetical protein
MATTKRRSPDPKPPIDRPTPRPRPPDPWDLAGEELAALDAKLPIALLPVRLETRFSGDELLVRIYPDTIHDDTLRRALTSEEKAAGATFWRSRPAAQQAAWRALIATIVSPWRAAWVMRATQPGGPDAAGDAGQRLRLLPRRWVIVGTLDGAEVIRTAGKVIPDDLRGGIDLSGDHETAEDLLGSPATRWVFEFEPAVACGMAVRIPLTGAAAVVRERGLDTLLVFGASSQNQQQDELTDLLVAHHYTRGAGFMAQGEPTNRTVADPDPRRPDPAALLARELPPAPPLRDTLPREPVKPSIPLRERVRDELAHPTATALADALGIDVDLLARLAGADDRESTLARAMHTVIWPTTLGGLLWSLRVDDPKPLISGTVGLLSPVQIEAVRQHFLHDVRGAGPLPTLRLGTTPYGFLPVCGLPLSAQDQPPTPPDVRRLQDVLHRLLGVWREAAASLPVVDPGADDSASDAAVADSMAEVLATQPWPTRYALRELSGSPLFGQPTLIGGMSTAQRIAYAMRVGLFTAAGLDDDELPRPDTGPPALQRDYDDDVITWVAGAAALADDRDKPTAASLLMQIAAHGKLALSDPKHPQSPADRAREKTEIDAAIKLLLSVPRPARARILGQSLGLVATRLDAWITATATRRLAELRDQTPRGLLVGGWGVVHDLRPAVAPPGGYALTPSLDQAAAAVALRSGHAAYSVHDGSPFAVDLSSERVRLARWLYDGVRQGQSLAALLGQRFERILHEHGADALIRDVREAALAARGRVEPPTHVVDGLLVARALWPAADPTRPEEKLAADATIRSLRTRLGQATQATLDVDVRRTPRGPHLARTALRLGKPTNKPMPAALGELVLAPLQAALDALADTATFEATHALFTGDRSAAAATLAAVDRGEAPPPALRSLDTPRRGVSVAHRVILLLADRGPAGAWPTADSAAALAEPRLERWAAAQLGAPGDVHAVVEVVDRTTGAVRRRDAVTLAALTPISALDFARLAAAGSWQTGPLATHLLAGRTATADESLRLTAPASQLPTGAIDLSEAHALAGRLALAWRGGRPATATELSPSRPVDAADPPRTIDRADLQRRLDALKTWLSGQAQPLAAATTRPAMLAVLRRFTTFGATSLAPPADLADETDEQLQVRVKTLASALTKTLAALEAAGSAGDIQAAFTAAAGPLVDGIPLIPVHTAATGLARGPLAGPVAVDELRISGWLAQLARVRPRMDALDAALKLSEARHALPPFALRAGQTGSTTAWAAVSRPTDDLPCTCITAVLDAVVDLDGPLAALALDAWSERVPTRDQPAGLALQFQSPAARAPQVVLLAVPSPGVTRWSLAELQRAAASALTLARIRPVGADRLEHLGHLLPCIFLDGRRLAVEPGGQRFYDIASLSLQHIR